MKRDIITIIVGMLFLATGIVIGGSMLGYFNFSINFAGWWTLFLIVPAILAIVQGGFNAGNVILLAVGGILLMEAQEVLPASFSWRLILPLVLLAIGFQLLFGGRFKKFNRNHSEDTHRSHHTHKNASASNSSSNSDAHFTGKRESGGIFTEASRPGNSYKTASVLFGGQDIIYGEEEFTGASYSAVFGGLSINLRKVQLVGDVIISVSAIFGGIDLILPDDVQVTINVTPILGGSECKYPSSSNPEAPRIIINGTASFGGIEIK